MAFFVSHLVHKKKKTKKKTAVWNCSSHPQNSPPPWRLKGSIIILIWTIAFISSGCVEVGERWISYFSLCHQKWVCGAGASWKSGTCLFPSGVFVGRGGREVRTGCVHPSSLLLLYPGFPNILEKFVISFFFFITFLMVLAPVLSKYHIWIGERCPYSIWDRCFTSLSLPFPPCPQESQSQSFLCNLSAAVGCGEIIRTGDIWCLILSKAFLWASLSSSSWEHLLSPRLGAQAGN